jgi:hypothetical protein
MEWSMEEKTVWWIFGLVIGGNLDRVPTDESKGGSHAESSTDFCSNCPVRLGPQSATPQRKILTPFELSRPLQSRMDDL